MEDLNPLIRQRIEKFEQLKQESGVKHFPNTYRKDTDICRLYHLIRSASRRRAPGDISDSTTSPAGSWRPASSARHPSSISRTATGKLQAFFEEAKLGKDAYELFKKLDIGDIIGLWGTPIKTKTGELSRLCAGIRAAHQVIPAPAGEMARAQGRGNQIPPALR
ncbi:MAG: hypothetical protein MZU95_14060 [Desulfomicrobium escambiense]|nr:hypothetical protein [Desulfomicrobium escambiense]